MADYAFLAPIFDYVDAAVNNYVFATVSNVAAAVAPVVRSGLTLYIILYGFMYYKGMIQEPIMDAAQRFGRMALIVNVALSVGTYSSWVANNLLAAPDFFVSVLGGASGTSSTAKATLDQILSDCLNTGTAVWEQASLWDNPGAYFMSLVIWTSAILCIGYAAFLIILSKVLLAAMVGAGMAAVTCLMFDATRKFFEAWLGQCINYALTSGLTVAVIGLLFGMFKKAAAGSLAIAGAADFGVLSIASMLILAVVCFLCLMQVQTLASAVSGGVALSTMGAVRAAAGKLMKAVPSAGSFRPSTIEQKMNKTKEGFRRDVDTVKRAGNWAQRKFTGIDHSANSVTGSVNRNKTPPPEPVKKAA